LNDPVIEGWFIKLWVKLKVIDTLYPDLRTVCYLLLRNAWDLQFQKDYLDMLDWYANSSNFYFGRVKLSKFEGKRDLFLIALTYFDVSPELWIPTSVFPRFQYLKDSKLHYSFEPMNMSEELLSDFRQKVKKYLRTLDIKEIYIAPADTLPRADLRLYNDGGVPRRDCEAPKNSFTCGFLLQKFNPKPLETREVWLPDMATKLSNSFWMIIGRQLLQREKAYPDDDPEVTWERIKDRLGTHFGYFDISAFGLQYPRELLVVIAEEIHRLFPNPDLQEQTIILKNLLTRKIPLELEDGTFVYPTRGIGLGYYEDLKTIGVLAILQQFELISVYGDQALFPLHDGYRTITVGRAKKEKVIKNVLKPDVVIGRVLTELRRFQFIIPDDKADYKTYVVKWSGWIMGQRKKAVKPKRFMSPLLSIFDGEFHWERKQRIRSLYEAFPEYRDRVSEKLPLLYDYIYGWEFHPGDTFSNIEDVGVSYDAPLRRGYTKIYKVSRLQTPKDSIVDNLVYSTPFFTEWKRKESKSFSIQRKEMYRSTPMAPSELFEYMNPRIRLNKTRKVGYNMTQSSVSDMYDLRLIAKYGFSLGKVTSNLFGDSLYKAIIQCSYASNPFEAYATGGYKVLTAWRRLPWVSSEMLGLVDSLFWHTDRLYHHMTSRFDMDSIDLSNLFPNVRKPKRKLNIDNTTLNTGDSIDVEDLERGPAKKLLILDKVTIVRALEKSSVFVSGNDIMSDIHGRTNDIEDPFSFEEEDIDEDILLEDLEDVDEDFYS
jgi:hypothetical protein